ncbi:unnamed protein product [Amoebophrya sp. A25]|nr:unnamed protein product [Amoebophrya sp. A25]|eukprot:GSA25T00009628001.1
MGVLSTIIDLTGDAATPSHASMAVTKSGTSTADILDVGPWGTSRSSSSRSAPSSSSFATRHDFPRGEELSRCLLRPKSCVVSASSSFVQTPRAPPDPSTSTWPRPRTRGSSTGNRIRSKHFSSFYQSNRNRHLFKSTSSRTSTRSTTSTSFDLHLEGPEVEEFSVSDARDPESRRFLYYAKAMTTVSGVLSLVNSWLAFSAARMDLACFRKLLEDTRRAERELAYEA